MKTYTYKGYTFYATDTTTDKPGTAEPVPVYEVEGLKGACSRPFLTTIAECKEFIDECTQGPLPPATPEQQADIDKAWDETLDDMKKE